MDKPRCLWPQRRVRTCWAAALLPRLHVHVHVLYVRVCVCTCVWIFVCVSALVLWAACIFVTWVIKRAA